jgi:hypothetical protein
VKQTEPVGSSLFYDVGELIGAASSANVSSQSIVTPSPSDDEDHIAVPSAMPASTKHGDLPTQPPPIKYWKLKKLDNSANVMDYWIRSSQEWDIDGIESDIAVCLGTS